MARLAFCDYNNMIAILEKYEHNKDFHQIVDFVEASHIRYALTFNPTVYVSHILQFWSTARIETTEEGTKILATVDGKLRIIFESSIRRNLKLNNEAGISSFPDAKLFENLQLMEYNILPNQKFTFQKGQFSHQRKYLIHTIMQCLSPKSSGFNEFSSNIATALVCLATNRVYNFSKMIFDGMVRNVNNKVSKFLMYPMFMSIYLRMGQFGQIPHTHTYVVPFHTRNFFTTLRVNSNSFSGRIVPLFDSMLVPQGEGSGTPTESHHTPTSKASQSSQHELPSLSLPPIPTESLPTVIPSDNPSSQDRANKAKTSTLPSDSTPRVTSLAADEGGMQHKLHELTALCTSLQRHQSEMVSKFKAQELEINRLKARIKLLEDKDRRVADQSRDDALIKGRRLDEGEEAAKRVSDDTEEMATVLTSIDAASILTSGGVQVVSTAAEVATTTVSIPTGSGVVPTASPTIPTAALIFTTATESTPYTRRKELEEEMARDAQRMNKQIAQDAKITRIHTEEELQMLIDGLDMNIKTVAKYLQEYYQFAIELTIERRIKLISDLQREFYTSVLRNQAGWKAKHFKGMTLEEIKEKFDPVWKQIQDFIPLGSKEKVERFKRKGLRLEQESVKKLKTSEEVKATKEVPEEKKKRDATAEKIALLLKSSSNYQSKSYDSYANASAGRPFRCVSDIFATWLAMMLGHGSTSRQAYLVETETPESLHTVASLDSTPPTSLPDSTLPTLVPILYSTACIAVRVPPAMSPGLSTSIAEVAVMSDSAFSKRFRSSYNSLSSSSSPPDLPSQKRYRGTSELVDDDEEEEDEKEEDDKKEDDEVEESLNFDIESLSLKRDEVVPEGQHREASVVKTVVGEPLGLGYGTLRRREIALGDGRMPSVFKVGHSSESVPEPERPKRVSAFRQPTLTTWIYPEDVPSISPLPISSPMIPLTIPSPVASPVIAETGGFLTELGA
nr:hypothetical protein [Tanacetum cinerariifolium]